MSTAAKYFGKFLSAGTNTADIALKTWHPGTTPASPLRMSTLKCDVTCSMACRQPPSGLAPGTR